MEKVTTQEPLRPYEINWERSIELTQRYAPDHEAELIEKIDALRSKLGEGFLLKAFRLRLEYAHAFKMFMFSYPNIVRNFHYLIFEAAKEFEGVEAIVGKISACQNLNTIEEALSLLRTGILFKKDFREQQFCFEPLSNGKIPDLSLNFPDAKKKIFVEVSEFKESRASAENHRQMELLFNQFSFENPGINIRGKLECALNDQDLRSVLAELNGNLASEVAKSNIYCFKLPNKFEVIAFKSDFETQARTCAQEKEIFFDGQCGPCVESDLKRLHAKIKKELRQLPFGAENVIVIWCEKMLLPLMLQGQPLYDHLIPLINQHPELSGVVLAAEFPDESFNINVCPDIIQIRHKSGVFYSMVGLFKEGKEILRDTLKASFLLEAAGTTP